MASIDYKALYEAKCEEVKELEEYKNHQEKNFQELCDKYEGDGEWSFAEVNYWIESLKEEIEEVKKEGEEKLAKKVINSEKFMAEVLGKVKEEIDVKVIDKFKTEIDELKEEAEENIAVEYSGSAMEVGFNVGYLVDVLSVLDEERVQITLADPNSSALLEEPGGGDALYVVMPMRL